MTIQMFDLTCANNQIYFSPYCWRIRMALQHKGLAFESVPWHFTDTEVLEARGGSRVPHIVDGETSLGDSWAIARYLDETYGGRPALMADAGARVRAKFVESWCVATVFRALRPLAVHSVFEIIADKDKAYFRQSREAMMGCRLEEISKDAAAEAHVLNDALKPMASALAEAEFVAGAAPDYSDYVLFGTLMWPYMVCRDNPLEMTGPVGLWFERMLDLFDGYARSAPRAHG